MKFNELRIGNWYLSTKFKVPIICEMGDFYEIYARADGSTEYTVDDIFEPIPLTEEWLLKFGFEKKEMYSWKGNGADYQPDDSKTECQDYVLNDSFFVRFESWGYIPKGQHYFDMWTSFQIFCSRWYERSYEERVIFNECKYVHQLQNLYFALTGNELEIKKENEIH